MKLFNTTILSAAILATLSLPALAGSKRTPANAPNIPCLNAVNSAFNNKWRPLHDMLRIEGLNLSEKERTDLHNESQRLLLAKADAIKTCNSNSHTPLSQILAPFK